MSATVTDRARVEAIHATITATSEAGAGAVSDADTAENLAERLHVPVALIWLATDGMTVEQIDELVAWWPRKAVS